MIKKFSGKLVYNNNAEYEIHSLESGEIHNISEIFKKNYEKMSPKINIKCCGLTYNIFNEKGILQKAVDFNGLFDWHVNGVPIGKRLFFHVDELVNLTIEADFDMDEKG